MSRAATGVHEAGEAFDRCAGNKHKFVSCRAKDGDDVGPWVTVKHWRCESAFFGYFLCGGVKKVTAAPHRGNARAAKAPTRMPAKSPKKPKSPSPDKKRKTLDHTNIQPTT